MKILFLSRWFPFPMDNGSKLRVYNLLRGLSQHHEVTLLSFADQPNVHVETADLQTICASFRVISWKEFNPKSLRARLATLSLKPRSIVDTFSTEMARAIIATLAEQQFDLIIASQLQMAAYYPYFGNVPAVFEEMEIGLFHDRAFSSRQTIRPREALTWFKLRLYLGRLLRAFGAVTVVSEQEKELVTRNFPHVKEVLVIPNCINLEDYRDLRVESKPLSLIFTGSFRYHANYEAMQWFVKDVFPRILDRFPAAQLIITGDSAGLSLSSNRNVLLTGYVDDVKPLIAASTVALAPLWSGGGTRLKILEAMAVGTPVVATSKGAEGLGAIPGEHIFVEDDPQAFAEKISRILSEPALRERLVSNARQMVGQKYDWKGVIPILLGLLDHVVRQ